MRTYRPPPAPMSGQQFRDAVDTVDAFKVTTSPENLEAPENPAWSSRRRWAVLGSFSFFSFTNAFILMDFADDYTLAEEVLGLSTNATTSDTSTAQVAFLYTLFLICVMPAMFLASYGVIHYNWWTMLSGQTLNVIGTWMRYVAVQLESYSLAIVSTVFAGCSAAAIVCSYAVIAERWFRPSQRGFATTVAVQSNYAGWALGSLLGLLAHSDKDFYANQVLLVQAIVVSLCLPFFFLGYRGGTSGGGGRSVALENADEPMLSAAEPSLGNDHQQMSVKDSAALLGRNFEYWVYAVSYAIIGGIGFSVPSAQAAIFSECSPDLKFDTPHTTFTNLSFILSGVVAGILISPFVKTPRQMEVVVLALSVLGSLAMTALTVLSVPERAASLDQDLLFGLLVVLMGLSGISTIGFIGMALNYVVSIGAPVSEAYTVGGVEWLIQGVGGGLGTLSAMCQFGFSFCVGCSWVATAVLLAAHFFFANKRRQLPEEVIVPELS